MLVTHRPDPDLHPRQISGAQESYSRSSRGLGRFPRRTRVWSAVWSCRFDPCSPKFCLLFVSSQRDTAPGYCKILWYGGTVGITFSLLIKWRCLILHSNFRAVLALCCQWQTGTDALHLSRPSDLASVFPVSVGSCDNVTMFKLCH